MWRRYKRAMNEGVKLSLGRRGCERKVVLVLFSFSASYSVIDNKLNPFSLS